MTHQIPGPLPQESDSQRIGRFAKSCQGIVVIADPLRGLIANERIVVIRNRQILGSLVGVVGIRSRRGVAGHVERRRLPCKYWLFSLSGTRGDTQDRNLWRALNYCSTEGMLSL